MRSRRPHDAGPQGGGEITLALQQISRRTHGIATPANLLDGAAFVGAGWAGPRLERWQGIAVGMASYLSDVIDGHLARSTGTESHIGDLVDHVGDKPKVAYALYHIWRKGLADRPLVGAVAAYNAATAGIAVYDRLKEGASRVEVTRRGKRAMFTTASGIGLQTIASRLSVDYPTTGRAAKRAGAALGYCGLLVYGLPAIREYWRMAR